MIATADQRWTRYARGVVPRPVIARRRFGLRGLGQCTAEQQDEGLTDAECDDTGTSVNLFPGGTLPQNTVLPVVATTPYTPPYGAIGSSAGCAAGYVVADSFGNCVPAASLVSSLSTTSGAATLGLTAAQAAAITAGLRAATGVVTALGPAPTSTLIPSVNPLSSISSTTWLIGGAVLVGVLLLSKKR